MPIGVLSSYGKKKYSIKYFFRMKALPYHFFFVYL